MGFGKAFSFGKMMLKAGARERKISELSARFAREFPGERMQGTLEGYCGLGMHYAMSQKHNEASFSRHDIMAAIEQEKYEHQKFAQEAFEIGFSQV